MSDQLPVTAPAAVPATITPQPLVPISQRPQSGAIMPQTFEDVLRIAKVFAAAGFWPEVQDQAKAAVKIMIGMEMGIPPALSINGLYTTRQGTVGLKADLIKTQMHKHGFSFRTLAFTDERAAVQFYEHGEPLGEPIEWTWKRAEEAELTTGKNATTYQHWKRNMLFKLCITDGLRVHCSRATAGHSVVDAELLQMVGEEQLLGRANYAPAVSTLAQQLANERAGYQPPDYSEVQDVDELVAETTGEVIVAPPPPPPKPTQAEGLRAAAQVAAAAGDTKLAEAAAVSAELAERISDSERHRLYTTGIKAGVKTAKLNTWLQHKYQTSADKPCAISKEQYAEALAAIQSGAVKAWEEK